MRSWLRRLAGCLVLGGGLVLAVTPSGAQDASNESVCRDGDDTLAVIDACDALIDPYGKPVWALMRRGHALLDDGQIEAANEDALLAVRAAARNSDAHALLGRAQRDAGNYEAALKALARSLALDPENAAAYFYRAQLNYWRDEKAQALEDIGQAVGIDGGSLDFRYWRGVIADETGDHETALSDFSWVISLDPENAEYLDSRAWTLYSLGRFPEALGDIDRALSVDPDLATPHETRGHILYASNRTEDAVRELRSALAQDPERTLARQLLTWIDLSRPPEPLATDCGTLPSTARRLSQAAIAVEQGTARAGEPVLLRWKLPETWISPSQPTYLVATFPTEVRFEGSGFLALGPAARGPYGMKFGESSIRTVTPLHVQGAPRAGVIEAIPFKAGRMPVTWQIVQVSACGEKEVLGKETAVEIDIKPGIPELVLQADEAPPTATEIRPIAGGFVASSGPAGVHVREASSGAPVLAVQGSDPVFSPSGRFLIVSAGQPGQSDVYDLVAARKLGRFGPGRLYWSHGDSLLTVDRVDARIQIVRTLHGNRYAPREPASDVPSQEDLVTPAGAEGATLASAAWSFELSIEGGVVGLQNTAMENAGVAQEEAEGEAQGELAPSAMLPVPLKLDLAETGMLMSLIEPGKLRRPFFKDELPARLAAFGIQQAAAAGWNNHDRFWRTRQAGQGNGPDRTRPVLLATQQESPSRTLTTGANDDAAFAFRQVAPFVRPDDNTLAAATVAAELFGHMSAEPLGALRAGRDERWISPLARDIAEVFPTLVAYFEADETGEQPVVPLPDPYPFELPQSAPSIDLNKPGRDLWTGKVGRERFWLSQSVSEGEAGSVHTLALLSTAKDGILRYASLLPEANMHVAMRDRRAVADEFSVTGPAEGWSEASEVSLAGGRYLTIVTRPVPHILVFDMEEWRLVCAISRPRNPGNIGDAVFNADARHVSQINRSGQIEVYDCADGGQVLTALYKDGEIVVVDKGGHFDGSQEAASFIAVRIPGVSGRHLLAQFTDRLAMPGLAKRVLEGNGPEPVGAFDPPAVSVAADRDGALVTARAAAGLKAIDVVADGSLVRRIDATGPEASLSIDASDLAGRGIVTLRAVDANGIGSAPVELLPAQPKQERDAALYMLAIGVDRYPEIEGAELKYSGADATRMVKSVNRSRLYSRLALSTMVDEEATAAAIVERAQRMVAQAGPRDTIVVSLAGQGFKAMDGGPRLALTETRLDDPARTSLDLLALAAALAPSQARVVLILDICHDGMGARAGMLTNDEAVAALSTAGGPAMVVLSAARGRQFSEQTTTLSGGRLSVAIRDILLKDREAVDTDGNGNISLNELARAAMSSVSHGSDGRQTPWIARSGLTGDFDIF